MGETPRTPSPSGRFFTKSSITVSENESKLLQSCIQSAAQGTSDNKKVAQILFQEQKASLLAKTQLGAWWAAKGHLHRARREEARFQTRTDQPMQCWHGKLWKTMCKGKETLLANHKEQEFSQKKRTGKRSTRVTLSHEIRCLALTLRKVKIQESRVTSQPPVVAHLIAKSK